MKKLLMVIALGTVISFSAAAQETKSSGGTGLSVGAEVGIPSGDLADGWKLGLGGSLKVAFPVTTNGAITVSGGYISFSGKDFNFGGSTVKMDALNLIPLKAGFRYNFGGSGFYFEPQIGYTFISMKDADSEGAFTWAPNVGYLINNAIDISARYESASKDGSSLSHIGFRVAYNFSLRGK